MKKSLPNKPFLSIIILNYNFGDYLTRCLQSISTSTVEGFDYEIIVIDNASSDDSIAIAKKLALAKATYFILKKNIGFAAGNNTGLTHLNSQCTHVLFLNPDTTLEPDTLATMMAFFRRNSSVDAATCKIILAKTGQIQPECHRGFPTPWRSFCHFTGLGKLFPRSAIFNGYFLGSIDFTKTQPIEACVGAFLMVKRSVGEKVNWWCPEYFFYGEDLDFCYQLQKNGYQLWYNPATQITHFQGISSGLKKHTLQQSSATKTTKVKIARASTQAMRIFYRRNYFKDYNFLTKMLVKQGINLLELFRVTRAQFS